MSNKKSEILHKEIKELLLELSDVMLLKEKDENKWPTYTTKSGFKFAYYPNHKIDPIVLSISRKLDKLESYKNIVPNQEEKVYNKVTTQMKSDLAEYILEVYKFNIRNTEDEWSYIFDTNINDWNWSGFKRELILDDIIKE